jgi:hypothetical protein
LKVSNVFNTARATRSDIAMLHQAGEPGHFVHFYEDDRFALENIGRLASRRMIRGDIGIFVATPAHLAIIEQELANARLDLGTLRAAGRFVTLDADATLSRFMMDGRPSESKFIEVVGGIIASAIKRNPNRPVLIFGEMVARLCAAGDPAAAIHLEQLWNALGRRIKFALWCAYPLSSFQTDAGGDALIRVCSEHSLVIPAESPL